LCSTNGGSLVGGSEGNAKGKVTGKRNKDGSLNLLTPRLLVVSDVTISIEGINKCSRPNCCRTIYLIIGHTISKFYDRFATLAS